MKKPAKYIPYILFLVSIPMTYFIGQFQFNKKIEKIWFHKEIIRVDVGENEFKVEAEYFYRNLSGENVILKAFAPFPSDKNHLPPVDITLCENNNIPILYEDGKNQINFYLIFKPLENKSVTLCYKQHVRDSRGRYILTTTKSWKKPMYEAYYYLGTPENVRTLTSSYPLDLACRGERNIYSFKRKSFLPEKEWDFSWSM